MLMGMQGNSNEGKLLSDIRFLRRVASLYYEDGQTQEAIAEAEFCSRQTISKALQRARERGIVRISVVPEERTGYLRNLSRDLRSLLGLDDLVLVPGRTFANQSAGIVEDVLVDITKTAADYLDQLLNDDDILAVSGGRTIMRNVVRHLKPSRMLPNLQVVPTIGFVETYTSLGDSNLVGYDIAVAYGAKHAWLPIPAIAETEEQRNQARDLPLARDVLKMMDRANIIMTGIWPVQINGDLVERGMLSQDQADLLQVHQPVGDINHWFFDTSGRCINEMLKPQPYYLTGLEIPRLKERIRKEHTKVILVAGANTAYIPAIQGILRAGVVNILITDHITASLLAHPTQV